MLDKPLLFSTVRSKRLMIEALHFHTSFVFSVSVHLSSGERKNEQKPILYASTQRARLVFLSSRFGISLPSSSRLRNSRRRFSLLVVKNADFCSMLICLGI